MCNIDLTQRFNLRRRLPAGEIPVAACGRFVCFCENLNAFIEGKIHRSARFSLSKEAF